MAENELIEWIEAFKKTYAGFPKESEEACDAAISALKEIKNYRKLGTLEELARADTYIKLAKLHGAVGEMIDKCAAYEEIGTVEECREARDKMLPRNPVVAYDIMVGRDDEGNPIWMNEYACPECGLGIEGEYICCPYCGTYINWDEVK